MKNLLVLLCLTISPLSVFSQIDQIDVVGIKPGITTANELARINPLVISGHHFTCIDHPSHRGFIDGKLSFLACSFGGVYSQSGRVKINGGYFHSSRVTFPMLRNGYTEKFGPPTDQQRYEFTNTFGRTYIQERIMWEDQQGNRLTILSSHARATFLTETPTETAQNILNNIGDFMPDVGMLLIQSKAQIDNDEKKLKLDISQF